ncbi:MAG: class I SAM-dependent methyltransferase [Thermodesulforhabdaceae bacterium]
MKKFNDLIRREEFWENLWHEIVENTVVLKTQWSNPERWKQFYDTVGPMFADLWGDSERLGMEIAGLLYREGIIGEEDRVLDVGCGSGWLSLGLARFSSSVTALDYSSKMVQHLSNMVIKRGINNIYVVNEDFLNFSPEEPFDVVIAAFFPQAVSPEGILKLEHLARKRCVFLLQYSKSNISIQQKLFEHIVGQPPLSPGLSLLLWCFGYLITRGRFPEIRKWHWESKINMAFEEMLSFYKAYFAVFGFDENAVMEAFKRVNISSTSFVLSCNLAVLWWEK